MRSEVAAILSALGIGTAIGTVVGLLVKHHLVVRSERRRRRIETDRATYQERMTRLIAANLCALIRSNRYREGEHEELGELIQNLSDGSHQQRFLDPKVQSAWALLVDKSKVYGWLRLTGAISERDIVDYTEAWEAWLIAARESFGPLPESDRPNMRRTQTAGSTERAA